MSRTKIIRFLGIGVLLFATVGYFFWQSRTRKAIEPSPALIPPEDRSLSLEPFASASEKAAKAGYRIVYQEDREDKTGRGVFYQGRGERGYEEIGWWTETQNRIEDYAYFTGSFVRWDDVAGSKDKYIILEYPEEMGEEETVFPPVRIGFEEDHLTSFGVENLDYGPNNPEVYSLAELGWVKDWENDLGKLIQRSGAVVTTFWRKSEREGAVRDENKNLVAGKLLIRRFGGVEQLEKELGRRIKIYALWW